MYTILTTYPEEGSANVGDKLIEHSLKRIVRAETGVSDFLTVFREESLEGRLDEVNSTDGILMPAFAIRDRPMYPVAYQLTPDLEDITVPLIPVGANYDVYPGDRRSRDGVTYSEETTSFLQYVGDQVESVSCREYHTCRVLERHGVDNTLMTGDPTWYAPDRIGDPVERPDSVTDLVFTPPLSPQYAHQAEDLIAMLADRYPDATKTCALHLADVDTTDPDDAERSAAVTPAVTRKNRRVKRTATDHGFEIRDLSGSLDELEFYRDCSLHVGYECHAHLYFLRHRLPSVLVAEDARGVGFGYTLDVGTFSGFSRADCTPTESQRKSVTSGYCTTEREFAVAPTRSDLVTDVEQFLAEEEPSAFRRYCGVADRIDDTYETVMKPFVRSLSA